MPLQSSGPYYLVTGKYQENGDTLSDFVNLVCQEAHNSSTSSQVQIKNINLVHTFLYFTGNI